MRSKEDNPHYLSDSKELLVLITQQTNRENWVGLQTDKDFPVLHYVKFRSKVARDELRRSLRDI